MFLDDAVPASRNFVQFGWAFPLAWAYAIGALEFFGGLLLIAGLFTRLVAAAIFVEMMVISFAVLYPSWSWGRRGMEYALFMGLIALAIALRGGGRYSLDRLIGRESRAPPRQVSRKSVAAADAAGAGGRGARLSHFHISPIDTKYISR